MNKSIKYQVFPPNKLWNYYRVYKMNNSGIGFMVYKCNTEEDATDFILIETLSE